MFGRNQEKATARDVRRAALQSPIQGFLDVLPGSEPIKSSEHEQAACPVCGSSRVVMAERVARAQLRLDAQRGVALDFTVTQVNCAVCGTLVNDDVNADTAAAYERLTTRAGMPPPQIAATLRDAMQHAELLPALSGPERQQDYEQARRAWDCLGMRYVGAGELRDALARVVGGFFSEGATEVQVQVLEQHVVQLAFITWDGFCPVRFSRTVDGGFAFYGGVPMYRFLGEVKPKSGALLEEKGTCGKGELRTAAASTEPVDAEASWRTIAEAGDPRAMRALAAILVGRGHLFAGELWIRRAVAAGDTDAMYELAQLLVGRGEIAQAEPWYRKAAVGGHRDAQAALAAIAHQHGSRPASGRRDLLDSYTPQRSTAGSRTGGPRTAMHDRIGTGAVLTLVLGTVALLVSLGWFLDGRGGVDEIRCGDVRMSSGDYCLSTSASEEGSYLERVQRERAADARAVTWGPWILGAEGIVVVAAIGVLIAGDSVRRFIR